MAITAAQVKELRELTGAGMMDCKKALAETDGNMEAARMERMLRHFLVRTDLRKSLLTRLLRLERSYHSVDLRRLQAM